MTEQEKRDLANQAQHAVAHPLVRRIIEEQLMNLKQDFNSKGLLQRYTLEAYGLDKIAFYAATVARAEALGIDPEVLRI